MTNPSDSIDASWQQRRAALEQIDDFTLNARVATGGLLGIKGTLNWRQTADHFDVRVAGPFGVGGLSLEGQHDDVTIRNKRGTFHTADPEAYLRKHIGWSFPVEGLRYWITGMPSPYSDADIDLDEFGRLLRVDQDGWTVEYTEYVASGDVDLPKKLVLTHDKVHLKVVVDEWSRVA